MSFFPPLCYGTCAQDPSFPRFPFTVYASNRAMHSFAKGGVNQVQAVRVFCGCQMVLPVLREECKAGKHCVALESNDAPVDTHLWVLLRGACRQDEGQAHQR